ncbi:MAG TPA: CDP-alcohol phosphatidyltransferase family protein [Gaiellaceae bacterium]|nr:CDP-alcohol phosphatidyltransferase family protein [Gaiellaceae bacterium]
MAVSTEDVPVGAAGAEPRRAGRELLLEAVFRPLATAFVPLLQLLRVPPPVVVLLNAATGLVAALCIARGDLLVGAVVLQLKTLLDNMDGQLARASGRVTLAGRYLDTLADLVVNAALFTALGYITGQPVLAGAAFVALTIVLAVDFNVTELYREAHGLSARQPQMTGGRVERLLASAYALLFAPLDRVIRSVAGRRFASGTSYDERTVTVLANMGLTTQLGVLGVCLALGVPSLYLWLVLACLVGLGPLQVRAERRARAVLA